MRTKQSEKETIPENTAQKESEYTGSDQITQKERFGERRRQFGGSKNRKNSEQHSTARM